MKRKRKLWLLSLLIGSLALIPAGGCAFADGLEAETGPGIDLWQKHRMNLHAADENDFSDLFTGVKNGEDVPLPQGYTFSEVGTYSYDDLSADLNKLKTDYPEMALDSLGKTADGRELYHVVVGNPNAKHKILVHAGIHAREYIVSQVAMREIGSLLKMQREDSKYGGKSMKSMLQNCAVHFVPMADPDGIAIVQGGLGCIGSEALRTSIQQMMEKDKVTDREKYYKTWKSNARGVNLNKNFDANWQDTNDRKGYPSKDEYKGEAAESEIESKALADLTRKEHFDQTISYHTQGKVIYWYFGEGSYVKSARRLAEVVKRNSDYAVSDYYVPNEAGGFKDWAEQKLNIPSVTIECGIGTSPVPEEQIKEIWDGQKGILPDLLYSYS